MTARRRARPGLTSGLSTGGIPAQTRARLDAGESTRREQARRHGLTLAELDAMRQEQGGACAVCGFTGPLVVDHDHNAAERDGHDPAQGCRRCVRGLLCDYCNTGLGKFRDDPVLLNAAAAFLERFMLRRSRIDDALEEARR
jgi:hypothetical protein